MARKKKRWDDKIRKTGRRKNDWGKTRGRDGK